MINLAQHAASVFGGLSALGSLKDTWSEESDASMFERMSSSVMTLSYALPSLKSGLEGGYKSIIKWGEAAGAAKTATTAAGEATATFGGSIVAIGKSMVGALAAAAPYILAIGAIVGILAAAYWEYTKDARALEEANENLEKQKKILNDTTAAWNELTQSIENYEKSQEAINKLTEGTTEWKNAIQDANAEVLNLIDKYP